MRRDSNPIETLCRPERSEGRRIEILCHPERSERPVFFYSLSIVAFFAALRCSTAVAQTRYDLVIHSGRVIDPETSLDAVRNVGIRGNQIVAISEQPLNGT